MPVFFKKTPKKGEPLSLSGVAAGLAAMAKALEKMEVHNGKVDWSNGIPMIVVEKSVNESLTSYNGELWVQGNHFYDSTNFSPDNENGTAITGTYSTAVWLQINLSTKAVAYSATGPAGATFGDNITWRRLSECGGSGKYVMC